MTTSPALYLDIDGVLHPHAAAKLDASRRNVIPDPRLFCWLPILASALAPYPEIDIIISSDWRHLYSDSILIHRLGPALGPRFIGVVSAAGEHRAGEIREDAERRELDSWLAIDDDPSVHYMRAQGDARLIACDPSLGLSSPSVQAELRQKLAQLAFSR